LDWNLELNGLEFGLECGQENQDQENIRLVCFCSVFFCLFGKGTGPELAVTSYKQKKQRPSPSSSSSQANLQRSISLAVPPCPRVWSRRSRHGQLFLHFLVARLLQQQQQQELRDMAGFLAADQLQPIWSAQASI
jgi:hypothetical protein